MFATNWQSGRTSHPFITDTHPHLDFEKSTPRLLQPCSGNILLHTFSDDTPLCHATLLCHATPSMASHQCLLTAIIHDAASRLIGLDMDAFVTNCCIVASCAVTDVLMNLKYI